MGATVGTRLMMWWKGREVGLDAFGNRYFTEKSGGNRRWVIYEGAPEASKVPAEWHAWLHHTTDEPPLGERPVIVWEKPHIENLTGTTGAYRPGGSVLSDHDRQKTGGDYQAWTPE
jgi:NADH:ubiquinone oxidoreductase subunit